MTVPLEFSDRIVLDEDCWRWVGQLNTKGFPIVIERSNGRKTQHSVRRIIYALVTGEPLPPNMFLTYKCLCETCVNPDHMVIGSRKVMVQIAQSRGTRYSNPTSVMLIAKARQAKSPLNWEKVHEIRASTNVSAARMAERMGVDPTTITKIRRGDSWREIGTLAFLMREI